MPEDSTNFSEDIRVPQGCDLFWAYAIEPLDGTGWSAQFITDFGTFTSSISVTYDGDDAVTTFNVHVTASTMAGVLTGVHTWRHLVTTSDGIVLPYGRGSIIVENA